MKHNVHYVWLAKGGRKGLKIMRFQLIIHLIKHGTNLTSITLDKVSIFSNCKQEKHKKGCNFKTVSVSYIVCI